MKVLIFGATGAAGLLTVRSALKRGHDVTVYVRNPAKLGITDPQLTVIKGELSDATAIDSVIAGQDAVVSVLGPTKDASGTPLTDGFRTILSAMKRHRVRRLVATSTPAFRQSQDRFMLSFWLGVTMIRLMVAPAYRDIVASATAISASDLDWTIVRHRFTQQDVSVADLYHEDVTVHVMFAFPHPLQISGRKAFIAAFEAYRANSGGGTPEMYKNIEIQDLKVHETTDPNVVIAQWTFVSNNTFGKIINFNIIVAEFKDGLIIQSRDYHNDITRAQASGTLPQLIGMLQTSICGSCPTGYDAGTIFPF